MGILGIRGKYPELMAFLSIFKGALLIRIKIVEEDAKCESRFWLSKSKFKLSLPLVFGLSDIVRCKY